MRRKIRPRTDDDDQDELRLWKVRHEEPLAREALAEKYYRTAMAMARHAPSGLDLELRFAAAHLALIDAINRFDPDRGLKFSTYLYQLVRWRILDTARAADFLERTDRKRTHRVDSIRIELAHSFGRWPTVEELIEAGVSDADRVSARRAAPQSINAPPRSSPSKSSGELRATNDPFQVAAPPRTPAIDRRDRFLAAVAGLSYPQRSALYLYFFAGLSMAEVGQVLDLSESRVSQIISAACRRLRSKGDAVRELLAG